VVGLISAAGGVQGLQAVNTMEFIVRALRGWAVPLVMPIPQAWKVFDEQAQARDPEIERQLRALGRARRSGRRDCPHGPARPVCTRPVRGPGRPRLRLAP
jgi:FMN reductase